MDQIASIERLRHGLASLEITDDFIQLQDLITELHFAYEAFRLSSATPTLADQRTLWDAAYYLLTALTNPQRLTRLTTDEVKDGLAISGLVLELLGRIAEVQGDIDLNRECYLNAAIANTLSRYEANAVVLAHDFFNPQIRPTSRSDFINKSAAFGRNLVFALLAREFLWIQQHSSLLAAILDAPDRIEATLNSSDGEYSEEDGFWILICRAIIRFAHFMQNGGEADYESTLSVINQARLLARDHELIAEHWLALRLLDCTKHMAEHSTWRVLALHGFSREYVLALTRLPWNSIYELWDSQVQALTSVALPGSQEGANILSDQAKRAVVSMPTSAGKTLVAEFVIVHTLETNPGAKCVYVAPTRALVDEIETTLHRRLRFLGFRVASVTGSFDLGGVEQEYLSDVDVVVLTPEKLDYLIRKRDAFIDKVQLIIFDEVHKVSEGNRGWFLETLITWLLLKPRLKDIKMVFMSAVLPHSQQPTVRLWVGKQNPAPIFATSWRPTRRLVGLLWYLERVVDWDKPVEVDAKGNRTYVGATANLSYRYTIGNAARTVHALYDSRFTVDTKFQRIRSETRYDRTFKVIQLLGRERPALVYFQEKQDLRRFCNRASTYLGPIREILTPAQEAALTRLEEYIARRLGQEFPIVKSLPFGVAFHHGDLPLDVRVEIESAYRAGAIRTLACTTTLAEGVNLPTENLILGYPQTFGRNRLSVRDFKNICGRAGRALVETEGRVIAIRHPEFAQDQTEENLEDSAYFDSLLTMSDDALSVSSGFLSRRNSASLNEVLQELSSLAQAVQDAQTLAAQNYSDDLAEVIRRLQIFIFTLFEDGIVDQAKESIQSALECTLLLSEGASAELKEVIVDLSQSFAKVCHGLEASRLRVFNASGLHFRSNLQLEELAERIAARCRALDMDDYAFEQIIQREDLHFLLESVEEAMPRASEYRAEQFAIITDLDHYGFLTSWITGLEFAEIRDRYLGQVKDNGTRSEICQSYISKQLTYKLPWVISALGAHIEKFGNAYLDLWLETLPAQIKYGVNTPEAVFLSSIGLQSRYLANRLAELYREEHGSMLATGRRWTSLEDWFLQLSPFDLRDKAPDLPRLAIRQAIRRVNAMRRPLRELQESKRLVFNLAGWSYYSGERYVEEITQRLRHNATVLFAHDRDNEYDEYAVSVHWESKSDETKLGYVPRAHNEELAELILRGFEVRGRILSVGGVTSSGWRPVSVQVEFPAI